MRSLIDDDRTLAIATAPVTPTTFAFSSFGAAPAPADELSATEQSTDEISAQDNVSDEFSAEAPAADESSAPPSLNALVADDVTLMPTRRRRSSVGTQAISILACLCH